MIYWWLVFILALAMFETGIVSPEEAPRNQVVERTEARPQEASDSRGSVEYWASKVGTCYQLQLIDSCCLDEVSRSETFVIGTGDQTVSFVEIDCP